MDDKYVAALVSVDSTNLSENKPLKSQFPNNFGHINPYMVVYSKMFEKIIAFTYLG